MFREFIASEIRVWYREGSVSGTFYLRGDGDLLILRSVLEKNNGHHSDASVQVGDHVEFEKIVIRLI